MGQLKINNFDVVHDSDEDADIVIINTCGFIDDAKEESINTILQAVKDKSQGFLKRFMLWVACRKDINPI